MFCFHTSREYNCKIILLDNRDIKCSYTSSQKGHEIFIDIIRYLNINESDYFGLRYFIKDTDNDNKTQVQWLDHTKSIESQFKKSFDITLYFNVKYYLNDPCNLKYENTRYLFYLQLRQDIVQGRLDVDTQTATRLFGYLLQDELGDYDPRRDTLGYVSEFEFMPRQTEELELEAHLMHKELKGLAPELCEMNFLHKVKWLDMYGVDLQLVSDESNVELFLGLTPNGIAFFKMKNKVSSYLWTRIKKFECKGTKFILNVFEDRNEEKTHTFNLKTKLACKYLFQCCIDQKEFFYKFKTQCNSPPKLISTKNRNSIRSLNKFAQECQQEPVRRVPGQRRPRSMSNYASKNDDSIIIDENVNAIDAQTNRLSLGADSQRSLAEIEWKTLENQNGLLLNNDRQSPTASVNSYRCPNPRRELNSENESLNRSKNSRRRSTDSEKSESGSRTRRKSKTRRQKSSSRRSSSHRMINTLEPQFNNSQSKQDSSNRILKSKSVNVPNGGTGGGGGGGMERALQRETCHETTMDEFDLEDERQKRQVRRRRRSKSPCVTNKPPSELKQHINYEMVQPVGFSEEQLREIPFVKVETTAPPFRISPHQKQRKYSPHRRRSKEHHESKSSVAYLRDGKAQIVKTTNIESQHSDRAVNRALISTQNAQSAESNIELDSGCDEMNSYVTKNSDLIDHLVAKIEPNARSLIMANRESLI